MSVRRNWYSTLETLTREARFMADEMFVNGEHPVARARKYVGDFDKVAPEYRPYAYALLAMACFADDKAARAMALKAGIRSNRGYTWSEAAYRLTFEDMIEQFHFDTEPLTLRTLSSGLGEGITEVGSLYAGGKYFSRFVNPARRDCLLALDVKGHRVYGCRRRNGHLALIYVLPTEQSVLVDEEVFGGEHPLYFTESTHFPSPVCVLHTLREIFRYAVAKTCFAPIHVDLCLVLPSENGELVNADDYLAEKASHGHRDWKEIEVRARKGSRARWLLNDLVPLVGRKNEAVDWGVHDYMVLRLFNSTAALYNHLPEGKFHSNLTPEVLEPISHYGFL